MTQNPTDVFDEWALTGRAERMTQGHHHIYDALIQDFQKSNQVPNSFLDIGCGLGELILRIKQLGVTELAGLDGAPEMVKQAQTRIPNAQIMQGDFEKLPFDTNSFSHVASVEALYYANDPDVALREIKRVLKPKGRFDMLIDFYRESPSTEIWKKMYDMDMIFESETRWRKRFGQAGLREVSLRRICHPDKKRLSREYKPSSTYPSRMYFESFLTNGTLWVTGNNFI